MTPRLWPGWASLGWSVYQRTPTSRISISGGLIYLAGNRVIVCSLWRELAACLVTEAEQNLDANVANMTLYRVIHSRPLFIAIVAMVLSKLVADRCWMVLNESVNVTQKGVTLVSFPAMWRKLFGFCVFALKMRLLKCHQRNYLSIL